ncbi:MAG: hypothetical protein H6Q67_126 [Firmicutes bacterium]|nr:hypothetical protein [Bacillota bacterium]
MILNIILLVVAVFFTGYSSGKFVGRKQGMREGEATMTLFLRRQSYEQGFCALCHESIPVGTDSTNSIE